MDTMEIIVKMDGIKNGSSGYPFVGLYILKSDDEIRVWQAIQRPNKIDSGMSIGWYEDMTIDEVIEEAKVDMHICRHCGKMVGIENLYRYSFAGACCKDCLPTLKAKYEGDGWTN